MCIVQPHLYNMIFNIMQITVYNNAETDASNLTVTSLEDMKPDNPNIQILLAVPKGLPKPWRQSSSIQQS